MDKQREMFEAWYLDYCKPGTINWLARDSSNTDEYAMSRTQITWDAWQAAIAAGAIAFRCANCKHLYEEKVSLCDCMPAVQEWEKVVVIEAAPEPDK